MNLQKNIHQSGFTLIELMITVAIIGILLSVALPSYQNYVMKTRRAVAASCLVEHAQFMERFRTTNLTFTGANLASFSSPCLADSQASYTFASYWQSLGVTAGNDLSQSTKEQPKPILCRP